MDIERTKQIKYLLIRCESLRDSLVRALNDTSTNEGGRYSGFKTYAAEFNHLVGEVSKLIGLNNEGISYYESGSLKGCMDTVWPQQKQVIESTLINTNTLIAIMNKEIDFVEDEYLNVESFIKAKLRKMIFNSPDKEKDIQNAIEQLFIGKGWNKGIDYDREAGKFEFSGREYIPDFLIPKLELCVEVKLLKENRKSKIIEEISADITAYSKQYKRILFVIYDMGFVRDDTEFRRDIENSREGIKVVIIKH